MFGRKQYIFSDGRPGAVSSRFVRSAPPEPWPPIFYNYGMKQLFTTGGFRIIRESEKMDRSEKRSFQT